MEVMLALLADSANISQEGKLNVLGAFTNISAQGVPARHPSMVLVVQLDASPSEIGQHKTMEVRLLNADGENQGGMQAEFDVPPLEARGLRINMGLVVPINDAVFMTAGGYAFDVLIDNESKKQVPFTVTVPLIDGGEAQ